MPINGLSRYSKLFKNIQNPFVYISNKIVPSSRVLTFVTKPIPIKFNVYQGKEHLMLIFKEIFLSDLYEIDQLCEQLPNNPVIIDIGMNVGYFDILLLSKIPIKKIYAYEPVPSNIAFFKETEEANKLVFREMNVYQMAVTGKPLNSIDLYLEDSNNATVNASVFAGFDKSHKNKLTVPCITLTDIIINNNLEQIDYLKMDCEGSEFDILLNTDPELLKRISKMTIEVHDLDNENNNIIHLANYLESLGYSTSQYSVADTCHILHVNK